jgi:hypothetical protein
LFSSIPRPVIICRRRRIPFIECVLAQMGSGCESLNAALSAEESIISPTGHVILGDDPG